MATAPRPKPNPRSPERRPWHPTPFDVKHVLALQALAQGVANAGQQRDALDWIIHGAAGTYQHTFVPDSERESAFAEGRRAVGLELVKLINLPAAAVRALREKEKRP